MTTVYIRNDAFAQGYGEYEYTQDIPNNRTTVHFRTKLYAKVYGFYADTRTQLWGSYYYDNGVAVPYLSWGTFNEHSIVINHNEDGTYPAGAGIQFRESDYESGTIYSTYVNLSTIIPTIPRPSTISVSPTSQDIGSAVDFTITRNLSTNTHDLTYSILGSTGTIGTAIATTKNWTLPSSFYTVLANTTTASMTVTCTTKDSGGTTIGTNTCTLTVNVGASIVPTATLSIDDVGTAPEAWGVWIKSKSKIQGTIGGTAGTGATIASRYGSANNQTFSTTPFTTNYLTITGTHVVRATITDSRGRTSAEDTETITVYDYVNPTISSLSVVRCDADGTVNAVGLCAKAIVTYAVSSCNSNNTKSLTVSIPGTSKSVTVTNYSGTVTSDVFTGINASSAVFTATLSDYFTNDVEQFYLAAIPISVFTAPSNSFSYTIGNTLAVTVDKKTPSFTDNVTVKVNNITCATRTNFTSSTIAFTSGEIAAMYAACPTSNSGTMTLNLETFSGATSLGTDIRTGTAYVTNSNPTFTNFTFADTKTASVTLTGDNQKIIDNYNTLRATITTANKAVAVNGATMVRYILNCGSQQITASYSAVATVTLDLSNVRSATFQIFAEDSRGNQTLVTKTGTFIAYTTPAVTSGSTDRTNTAEEETTLVLSGQWWQGNFGSSANATSVSYRYKQTSSSTYIAGTTSLTLDTSVSNVFSLSHTILGDTATGFSADKSFNVEVTITDSITSYLYYLVVEKGEFPLTMTPDGVCVGGVYDITKTPGLQVEKDAHIKGDLDITSLIASQLVSTNANKVLTSLATATYPSLTEISYVKGVTSAIQTQLNDKLSKADGGTIEENVTVNKDLIAGSVKGKNLFNINQAVTGSTYATYSVTNNVARVTSTRTTASNENHWIMISLGGSELLGKHLSTKCDFACSTTNKARMSLYYANNPATSYTAILDGTATLGSGTLSNEDVVVADEFPAGKTQVVLVLYATSGTPVNSGDYVDYSNIQVEIGSLATDYYEYEGIGYTSGTNANGSWVKYDDGRLECWGTKTFTNITITSAWGGVYTSAAFDLSFSNFPVSFLATPVVNWTWGAHSGNLWIMSNDATPSATNPGTPQLVRGTSTTVSSVTLSYRAVGRWK